MKKKNKKVFPFNKDLPREVQAKLEHDVVNPNHKSRQSSRLSKTRDDDERSNSALKQSLFALRRANKARRYQIQQTQSLKQDYLDKNPIPGVDYGRLENKKQLMIPDEYMSKLAEGGFVVFGAQSVADSNGQAS